MEGRAAVAVAPPSCCFLIAQGACPRVTQAANAALIDKLVNR